MAISLDARRWTDLMTRYSAASPERDRLVGVSVTLAARLLRISRSRVHQLLNEKKLAAVDVHDESGVRIGHMVTLASIAHRRRTVRARPTQWQPWAKAQR
jgi:hypothetical protein